MDAKESKRFYVQRGIRLAHIPRRSPDLNPIGSFWGWLRKQLRLRDLEDLRRGRPALTKVAFKARVRALLRTQRAQKVAKAKFAALRRVCAEVVRKRGAASRS